MDIEERLNLIVRNAEEIVTPNELRILLETTSRPKAYWGFECSGLMHIGMGLVCGSKIKDIARAGFDFTIFLADWHSWINNKLGGLMENIRLCGEYFKQCFEALGVTSAGNVRFVWASELADDIDYWEKVIRIAKSSSLLRVRRALTIMGRELDMADIETAWVFYPCMQAADIFQLELDMACGGIDQRKAHMLARDVAEKIGWKKPVCLHTPLLSGLQPPAKIPESRYDEDAKISEKIGLKMSKSKPESCIFVHDSPEEIRAKIRAAYCPPKQEEGNPILEHAKYIVFPELGIMEVPRPSKYGGPITFEKYGDLRDAYLRGEIHPLDLKNGVAEALIKILEPVREYFRRRPKLLDEMLRIEAGLSQL
ncbi:MAG: tyrosine--tRNA ligase [Candidatus Bathyarchaeia archaeon]|nr:tyrosine--tRNA ligase [Candidatus Bathyarchaeota archaeon]